MQYKACTFYKLKTYGHNRKVSLFGIALIKKKANIKLRNAGTIDRFDLAFQYEVKKKKKKNGQKQWQIRILYKCKGAGGEGGWLGGEGGGGGQAQTGLQKR